MGAAFLRFERHTVAAACLEALRGQLMWHQRTSISLSRDSAFWPMVDAAVQATPTSNDAAVQATPGAFSITWRWNPSHWTWEDMESTANYLELEFFVRKRNDKKHANANLVYVWWNSFKHYNVRIVGHLGMVLELASTRALANRRPQRPQISCQFASRKKGGTWLADGWTAILWSLVGDLEYLTQCLKLPHYSSKTGPCALCQWWPFCN